MAEDIGTAKPDAAAFDLLAKTLALPPERISYVSARLDDLRAARSAGMQTIFLAGDAGHADPDPTFSIAKVDQLPPLLAESDTRALLGLDAQHAALARAPFRPPARRVRAQPARNTVAAPVIFLLATAQAWHRSGLR
jgi:beta-phosphoglucomutase-like phosphatase (HAD superfamily)